MTSVFVAQPTEFSPTAGTTVAATPTCCCCCCCCAGTLIGFTTGAALITDAAARETQVSSSRQAIGVVVAALTPLLALLAIVPAAATRNWFVGAAIPIIVLVGAWYGGFAAVEGWGTRYRGLFAWMQPVFLVSFAIEFVAGLFLVLMFGAYFIVFPFVAWGYIALARRLIKDRQTPPPPPLPPPYLPGPPA